MAVKKRKRMRNANSEFCAYSDEVTGAELCWATTGFGWMPSNGVWKTEGALNAPQKQQMP
jgi:hypothetical protein